MSKKYVIVKDNEIVTFSSALDRAKEYAAMAAQDGPEGNEAHIYSFVTTAINRAVSFRDSPPSDNPHIPTADEGIARRLAAYDRMVARGDASPRWSEEEEKTLINYAAEMAGRTNKDVAAAIKQSGWLKGRTESAILNRLWKLRQERRLPKQTGWERFMDSAQ